MLESLSHVCFTPGRSNNGRTCTQTILTGREQKQIFIVSGSGTSTGSSGILLRPLDLCSLQQTLSSIRATVQNGVLDKLQARTAQASRGSTKVMLGSKEKIKRIHYPVVSGRKAATNLEQLWFDVGVYREIAGVDDGHVHPSIDCVEQKSRVHRLSHTVEPAERKGEIRQPAADFASRTKLLNSKHKGWTQGATTTLLSPFGCVDKIEGVRIVFFDTGGDREDVWIENDILRVEVHPLRQQLVGTCADSDLAKKRVAKF